ncbi:MAG: phage integrase family protein [Cellulomonas sp.]|uniref:tyrosine-type recombinase/integrase n=1 Tax=Cellulomonas sp. TaxID=40001 RepID=UPI0017FC333F|nr:phage integrase family protein [Cellulomonas sp.]
MGRGRARVRNTYDLIFATDVGSPLNPSNARRVYSRLAKEAGLTHLHPHMLRHAAASLLSAAGVPIEDISDTLGHRNVNVTAEISQHPIAPLRSGRMVAMNQLIDSPSGEDQTDKPRRATHVPITGVEAAAAQAGLEVVDERARRSPNSASNAATDLLHRQDQVRRLQRRFKERQPVVDGEVVQVAPGSRLGPATWPRRSPTGGGRRPQSSAARAGQPGVRRVSTSRSPCGSHPR